MSAHGPDNHTTALGDHDDPKASPTVFIGAVGTLLTVFLIIALQAFFYTMENREFDAKVTGRTEPAAIDLRAEQEATLAAGVHWVDEQRGMVAIPIDRAMRLVADDLAAGRPAVTTRPSTTAAGAAE